MYPINQGTTQSTKQRQVMALQAKLAELAGNVKELEEVVSVTAEQAAYVRDLGAYHGGLYVILASWMSTR